MTDDNKPNGKGHDNELSTLMGLKSGDEIGAATDQEKTNAAFAHFAVDVTNSILFLSEHQSVHCKKIADLEKAVAELKAMLIPTSSTLVN